MCRLSKPTQKSLNNPLSKKDSEFKSKRLPTKKALDPDGFPSEFFKHLKKIQYQLTQTLLGNNFPTYLKMSA